MRISCRHQEAFIKQQHQLPGCLLPREVETFDDKDTDEDNDLELHAGEAGVEVKGGAESEVTIEQDGDRLKPAQNAAP
jgi:hypothetical protein